jgi:hypothetical protein
MIFYKKLFFGYTRFCGYFLAIFQNTLLQKFLEAIWLFSGYFWAIFNQFSSISSNFIFIAIHFTLKKLIKFLFDTKHKRMVAHCKYSYD